MYRLAHWLGSFPPSVLWHAVICPMHARCEPWGGAPCSAIRFSFPSDGKMMLEHSHFVEALGYIPHDGGHSLHAAFSIFQRNDRELHRDARPVLADTRNRKEVAMIVPTFASAHHLTIPLP